MTKRCRNRVRSRGKLVLNSYNRMVSHFGYQQNTENWWEWTFRTISQRQAELKVLAGEVERVVVGVDGRVVQPGPGAIDRCIASGQLRVVGYRAVTPVVCGDPTPCSLTMATLDAVYKRAAHIPLDRREEREIIRFIVWPLIGDTKALCVRPPMSVEQRRLAERLAPISKFAEQSRLAA